MSERILTLFGEEMIPIQPKAIGKIRAKKKSEENNTDVIGEVDQGSEPEENKTNVNPEVLQTPITQEIVIPIVIEERNFLIPDDWKGDKKYYTIGEVAALFKVKTSHIRFWTNEFKLKVRTTRKGDRMFNPDQVRELRAIHHLVKERGFTLTGAKAKLKSQNKKDVETIDLKQLLLQLRSKLVVIRNQLS